MFIAGGKGLMEVLASLLGIQGCMDSILTGASLSGYIILVVLVNYPGKADIQVKYC